MEIVEVKTHLVDSDQPTSEHGVKSWLFVTIHTDNDIIGIGESGAWGYLESSEKAIKTYSDYLIGKDPQNIDHHWQYLYRNCHFRGAAIMGAISAIDIALWDIVGKYHDEPVSNLLGGQCRERARVYAHVRGSNTDELVKKCEEAKKQGFTAVGHLSPLLDESRSERYFETHRELITNARERVRRFREAVGDDVDLCIEIHRRLKPHEAIVLAKEIEEFTPLFYEDPILPDNFDQMGNVSQKIDVPIATGERLHTIYEFNELLKNNAVQYIRPDVCLAGGITHSKKISSLAEAYSSEVVPHNPLSPVSTAACLQLSLTIPNFKILEYPYMIGEDKAPGKKYFEDAFIFEDGFLVPSERPGIGIDFDIKSLEDASHSNREIVTRLHRDGSVVDQ